MQNLNKRGVSEVVSTLVLITLAFASVALASYSVFGLIRSGDLQSSPTYNCLDLTTRFQEPIRIASTCLNPEGEIEVLLQRSSENINLNSISFVIADETWTCSQEICAESCEVLNLGTTKKYFLSPQIDILDEKLEVYIGTCKIDEVIVRDC